MVRAMWLGWLSACLAALGQAAQADKTCLLQVEAADRLTHKQSARSRVTDLGEEWKNQTKEMHEQMIKQLEAKAAEAEEAGNTKNANAANAALRAMKDIGPELLKCFNGDCNGAKLFTGIISAVSDMEVIITAISATAGPWIPVVGTLGQLLALLFTSSTSASTAITKDDVKQAITQSLYNFNLDKTKWKFSTLIGDILDKIQLYGLYVDDTPEEFRGFINDIFKVDKQTLEGWNDKMANGYKSLVDIDSYRQTELAGLRPFSSDCKDHCYSHQSGQDCLDDLTKGREAWQKLRLGLMQFKQIGTHLLTLKSIVVRMLDKFGCSWPELQINHCDLFKDYLFYTRQHAVAMQKANEILDTLDEASNNDNEANQLPWIFDQYCDAYNDGQGDQHHCNYPYAKTTCSGKGRGCSHMPHVGWVEVDSSWHQSDCETTLRNLKDWNRHFGKLSSEECQSCHLLSLDLICASPYFCMDELNSTFTAYFTDEKTWF